MESHIKRYYIIAIIFAICSSARIPFLPEFQFFLLLCSIMHYKKINYNVILLLTTILCTHHYVIPDSTYRFLSDSYPSIYTRSYGAIKIFDLLVIIVFLFSVKKMKYLLSLFSYKRLPGILLVTSFIGCVFLSHETFAKDQFLFLSRNYLFFISIFLSTYHFNKRQFIVLSKLAILAWITKMIFAILIPHPHPLFREILGFDGIIFFAGDEYLTIPYYLMILLLLDVNMNMKKIFCAVSFVLLLTIIAQRKGGISVLLPFLLLCYAYYHKKRLLGNIVKCYYIVSSALIFLFLSFPSKLIENDLLLLAFEEYSNLAQVSYDSVRNIFNNNLYEALFGISPFGKYEIIGLEPIYDHPFSYGEEVGERFRYMLWSFPLGRCILNVGIIGFILVVFKMLCSARLNIPMFYLTITAIPVCYYYNLTPVLAFAMGIIFSVMISLKRGTI